jgi:hypothetical protein
VPQNVALPMRLALMSTAETTSETGSRIATCTNIAACAKARAGEAIEWYSGAGEYCPDCGEVLKPDDVPRTQSVRFDGPADAQRLPSAEKPTAANGRAATATPPAAPRHPTVPEPGSRIHAREAPLPPPGDSSRLGWPSRNWLWLIGAAFASGALVIYAERRPIAAERTVSDPVEVCAIPSAQQLARDLIRGLAAKTGVHPERFVVRNGSVCDVRFSSAAATPDAVIARDGIVAIVNPLNPISRISEKQLRGIYNGSIQNWAQLGGQPGRIVALMPADASDEARAIASSVFFGAPIDSQVRREGSSTDVTRAVTGADRTSRASIGLVAFSQSIPAKVVPLAYLPPPSVLTIGTHRYPYTLTIAIETDSERAGSDAERLVDYAKSNDGAQLVAKEGLVGRGDL